MYHLDITCYVNRSLIERLFFLKNVRASKRTKISQQSLSCWAHKNIQLFLKVWNLIQLLVGTNQTFWLHNINFDNNVPELPLSWWEGGKKSPILTDFYRSLEWPELFWKTTSTTFANFRDKQGVSCSIE